MVVTEKSGIKKEEKKNKIQNDNLKQTIKTKKQKHNGDFDSKDVEKLLLDNKPEITRKKKKKVRAEGICLEKTDSIDSENRKRKHKDSRSEDQNKDEAHMKGKMEECEGEIEQVKLKKAKKKQKKSCKVEKQIRKKVFESLLREGSTKIEEDAEFVEHNVGEIEDFPSQKEASKTVEKKMKRKKKKSTEQLPEAGEEGQTEHQLPGAKEQCLSYLEKWQNDRENWSFKKSRQIWLIKHMYDESDVDCERFSQLLEYLAGAKGSARQQLIERAQSIFPKVDGNENAEDGANSKLVTNRARMVLQLLVE